MSKSSGRIHIDPGNPEMLFFELEERKRRKLFLPRLLPGWSQGVELETPERDQAHKIILKWADLESAGKLRKKETSVDAAFLQEVFGEALGYRGFSEGSREHEREHHLTVPGVGDADGALGKFAPGQPPKPLVVIELKGTKTSLDKDKSNGRTAVQQAWDYLNALEGCQWAVVSNFTTIRLYHKDKGSQAYERFTLQELRDPDRFKQFYYIFERGGLVQGVLGQPPRALKLLKDSEKQQNEVGDKLYEYYSSNRLKLIEYLHQHEKRSLADAIGQAQKLVDRIIFICFCEDRKLIPGDLIHKAYYDVPFLSRVTNPKWQNFLSLFHAIDKGHPEIGVEHGYNGGLFAHDPAVDELQLADEPWTNFFHTISTYDFADEVNVEVLGHLFERSITELERLRNSGLFAGNDGNALQPNMPKSAQRKRLGIYYTPPDFTTAIVQFTVDELIIARLDALRQSHELTHDDLESNQRDDRLLRYWQDALAEVRQVKVCDPACGSGAFLIQAYEVLWQHYTRIITELTHQADPQAATHADEAADYILADNLYGADLTAEGVEITQLALWLRSAKRGKTLANLSANIVRGNSLVTDSAVHPHAFHWRDKFPEVFNRPGDRAGFDCIIGNPPWERLKLQEREFFSLTAPDIAAAVNAATRQKMIGELQTTNPEHYQRYLDAKNHAEKTLTHVRSSGEFPLTAKGDINTYMLFAELGRKIVAPGGRVGLLVPSGIATDLTTAEFFNTLIEQQSLIRLYDFENKKGHFEDVHRAFKFSILCFGGSAMQSPQADFVFFAHDIMDLRVPERHIALSAADLKRMNPNSATCPIFRTRRDAELTKAIYGRVRVLIDHNRQKGGNPWGVSFMRMFDQTNDAALFTEADWLKKQGFKRVGNQWHKGKRRYLPLYEAKMIQAYDHRAASVEVAGKNWMRQGQTMEPTLVEHQNPEHVAQPRWWVEEKQVDRVMGDDDRLFFMGFKDITSPTNQRTMIAAMIPRCAVTNHFPVILTDQVALKQNCLLANFNSIIYDYLARQKIGGITLNFFIVEQLPTLPPEVYAEKCPWSKRETLEKWISERVLKLSCTAEDMKPLAEACKFNPPEYVWRWNPAERAQLRAELDAAYFHLYGMSKADVAYILTTFQGLRQAKDEATLLDSQETTDPMEAMLTEEGRMVLRAYEILERGSQ